MKISCGVIRDLLPLYVEKMTGEESGALIREHIAECRDCSAYLAKLQKPVDDGDYSNGGNGGNGGNSGIDTAASNENPLRLVRNGIRRRKITAVLFSALLVFTVMLAVFARLVKPEYISYEDSGITVVEAENGNIYAQFSGSVTSCRVLRYVDEDGQHNVDIRAWTSPWDKLLGKTTPSVLISSSADKTDLAFYCDFTKTADNVTVIYGTYPYEHITAFPRLVLGYYFAAAFIGAALLGLVWFILRKYKKAGAVCGYLLAAPVAYMLGHLLVTTRFTTFSPSMDFIFNCIAALAIYGILITGAALIKQNKRDKLSD